MRDSSAIWGLASRKKAVAFLKKSSAKNFCASGAGSFERPRPRIKKVFLLLFLQKKKAFLPFLLNAPPNAT
jgi:hypothetical protein